MGEMHDPLHVRVRGAGYIAEYFPGGEQGVDLVLTQRLTVTEIVDQLGIAPGLVVAVTVDGRRRSMTYVPDDGEVVVLLAPPGGG